MAANNSELQQLLLHYIDSVGGKERMREVLQSTSVEVRYNTLMSVRGGGFQYTAVHRAAVRADLDSLKCMMSGFTSDQLYNILKAGDTDIETAMHRAAAYGHTNTIMFLLSKLSHDERYNILNIQSTRVSTALHAAATSKQLSALRAMLTSVSPGQQRKLLNITDRQEKRIGDITPLPELPYDVVGWTNIELDGTNQKLAEVEMQQKAAIDQLKADFTQQKEQQTNEFAEVIQRFTALEILFRDQKEEHQQQAKDLDAANKRLTAVENDCNLQKNLNKQLRDDMAKQRKEASECLQRVAEELRGAKDKILAMEAVMDKEEREKGKLSEKSLLLTQGSTIFYMKYFD